MLEYLGLLDGSFAFGGGSGAAAVVAGGSGSLPFAQSSSATGAGAEPHLSDFDFDPFDPSMAIDLLDPGSPTDSDTSGGEPRAGFKRRVILESEDLEDADIGGGEKKSWRTRVLSRKIKIQKRIKQLHELARKTGKTISTNEEDATGCPLLKINEDASDPMATLWFDITFDFNVEDERDLLNIEKAVDSIRKALRTGDEDLDKSMQIVAFRKGSLVLLIKAPEAAFEFIYATFVVNKKQINVDGIVGLVSMDPVFNATLQGAAAINQVCAAFCAAANAAPLQDGSKKEMLRFSIKRTDRESGEADKTTVTCLATSSAFFANGSTGSRKAAESPDAAGMLGGQEVRINVLAPLMLLQSRDNLSNATQQEIEPAAVVDLPLQSSQYTVPDGGVNHSILKLCGDDVREVTTKTAAVATKMMVLRFCPLIDEAREGDAITLMFWAADGVSGRHARMYARTHARTHARARVRIVIFMKRAAVPVAPRTRF